MADDLTPQLYLITPDDADLAAFPDKLAGVLDAADVACVRLRMATADTDRLQRAADACRVVTDARDVALVIDSHVLLAQKLGLDGVHLNDGPRSVPLARKELGEDAIVGAFCDASSHDGMTAGERGADYISFGPVTGGLGDGTTAEHDLFAWWSDMIELPVVAEGGLAPDAVTRLAPVADFFALGEEIWSDDNPVESLRRYAALLA